MVNLSCNLNLDGLVENEKYNIHKKVRFNFILLLFYLINYLLCCIYLYFSRDSINNLALKSVILLGLIIVLLSYKILHDWRYLKLSKFVDFSSIEQIENFFNISFKDNIHVLACKLFNLSKSISVDKTNMGYCITFRHLKEHDFGMTLEFDNSTLKTIYKPNLEIDEIELRGTETILVKRMHDNN